MSSPRPTSPHESDSGSFSAQLAELQAANNDDKAHVSEGRLAPRTMLERLNHWNTFNAYINDMILAGKGDCLVGSPDSADYYLNQTNPEPSLGMFKEWLYTWARGSVGKIEDIPTITTALIKWSVIRARLEEYRGEKLAPETTKSILNIIQHEFTDDGILSKKKMPKPITDRRGLKGLAQSAVSPAFVVLSFRTRITILFLLALHIQQPFRIGASLPRPETPTNAPSMSYSHYKIHVFPPSEGSRNIVTLTYAPPYHKTETSEKDKPPIISRSEYWECPISILFTLAELDDAMPAPYETLLEPQFLQGAASKTLSFTKPDLPICRLLGEKSERASWTTKTADGFMRRLSLVEGLPVTIGFHALRRMGGCYMLASGEYSVLSDSEEKCDRCLTYFN